MTVAESLRDAARRFFDGETDCCRCSIEANHGTLVVDARDCSGRPATEPACRERAARAAAPATVDELRVRCRGADRYYGTATASLLAAAGRFADLAREAAPTLAERAPRAPVEVAEAAAARASPVDEVAAEAGLLDAAEAVEGWIASVDDAAAPFAAAIVPTVAGARIDASLPGNARLRASRELDTGASARLYDVPDAETDLYHLEPVEATLDGPALRTLADARDLLAERRGPETAARAIRAAGEAVVDSTANGSVDGAGATDAAVANDAADTTDTTDIANAADDAGAADAADVADAPEAADAPDVPTLAPVLEKHTSGYGVLEDCFADEAVTDVYAAGPAAETPLRVVADGEHLRTNVTMTPDGVAALASRLRRESGRSFSRAAPTIDATARVAGERVRVAGLLEPATDGRAFAFRSGGQRAFTLPALVANGTLSARAAGLLSVAVERSAACIVAGPRGAGKTTLLSALCWELPATQRLLVVEDTPELPVDRLQDVGRDAQALHTTLADGPGVSPTEALRTALRLGEGAIALGEVRGEEAAVLFEAMRVGAGGGAVLGTIHGDGADAVRERVVADLGVAPGSFAATDLVVTCERSPADADDAGRRVARVEEVRASGAEECRFSTLFHRDGNVEGTGDVDDARDVDTRTGHPPDATDGAEPLVASGPIDRGNSALLHRLAEPGESYARLREQIQRRGERLAGLARRGATAPAAVTTAHARAGDRRC